MKLTQLAGALILAPLLATSAQAADIAKGEKTFKRCKACHAITAEDGTKLVKGGVSGPNLYGVIGRTVGTLEGYEYGPSAVAAGEAEIVWDEENMAIYLENPSAWLKEVLDDPDAKSKMTFKLKKGGADMAAYLATMGPS